MKKKALKLSKPPKPGQETGAGAFDEIESLADKSESQLEEYLAMLSQSAKPEEAENASQEQIPLVQLTLSMLQIEHDFKRGKMKSTAQQTEDVIVHDSHFIGMGRSQQCQWTMVTAPLIGVAKRQGKIEVNF